MPFRFLFGFLVVMLFGIGCSSPSGYEGNGLQITNLEHSTSTLTATAQRGDSRVTIFIRRGGPRVEGFIRDPEIDSPYESDISASNRYGDLVLMSFASDVPIDTAQAAHATNTARHETSQEKQLEDLQLITDAADLLRTRADVGEEFRWELRDVHNMASGARERAIEYYDDFQKGNATPQTTPDINEIRSEIERPAITADRRAEDTSLRSSSSGDESVGMTREYLGSGYTHVARIKWALCCWNFGEHSSVLVDVFNSANGQFVTFVSTRNHGREANDPSMQAAAGCPQSWGGRANMLPPLQPFIATDTFSAGDAGGCGSPYGLTSGNHVCNDDSLAEYWHTKYNANSSWVTCGDSTLRSAAPGCN